MANLSKRTLREQIFEILRKKILLGEIKPGSRLIETEITAEYNVSRGPVREALRQMEEEGLITYIPQKGCVVSEITYEDIREAYLIRAALEILAIEICNGELSETIEKKMEESIAEMVKASTMRDINLLMTADEKFHCCIVEAAGFKRLKKMWKSFEGVNAATYLTISEEELTSVKMIERNHRIILNTIKSHDVEAASKKIKEHYGAIPERLYDNK